MPEAPPSAPERARFATLAQLARDIAVSVGHASGMEDTAIVTRNGVTIHVSRVAKLSEAFAVASLRFGETKTRGSRFATLNATCARLRVIGSAALEICYLATGRFDLFVHEALSPWDIAGPALIA